MNKMKICFAMILATSTLPAMADSLQCGDMTTDNIDIKGLEITKNEVISGDKSTGEHCLVQGVLGKYQGKDGSLYGIKFELRLPDEWNGDFIHQFNGGNDGEVVPALGEGIGDYPNALSRGFAVVSSNAGHDAVKSEEAGLAGGARFGFDPQARINYGYNAVASLDPVAKKIVNKYYGKNIKYSYGMGRSNGGRHAMVAAARMPEAFDGLLVGFPGFNLPKAAIQHAWDIQAFKSVNGDVRKAFSRNDLKLVSNSIIAACDSLDGLKDGIVSDSEGCQEVFNIEDLQCDEDSKNNCLSKAQIEALNATHQGPSNSSGKALYSDWPWDTGIASQGWRTWKIESPIPAWDHRSIISVMGASSLAQVFTTPPIKVEGSPEALESYLLSFDFDKDAPKIYAITDQYKQSAMEFMTPPGSDDPKLEEFKKAGGKMIIYHGNSDPAFSVNDTTDWYRKLDENNNGLAEDFVKLYRVPGLQHGAGGIVTDNFDFLSALTDWVERGESPGAITASIKRDNVEAKEALGNITRKLCPYPEVAIYTGGEPSAEKSFACKNK